MKINWVSAVVQLAAVVTIAILIHSSISSLVVRVPLLFLAGFLVGLVGSFYFPIMR